MTMAPPSFLFRGSWPKVSRNTAVLRREIVCGAQASNSTTMPMALRCVRPDCPVGGTNDHG